MASIKVSVIMPVFNSKEYIEEALVSLLNQSFADFEIICIDDGSTDTSPQIIRRMMLTDKRISLHSQDNKYAGVARNTGIQMARGEYVLFLDSDDVFEGNMIEKSYYIATKEDADIVIFGGKSFEGNVDCAISRPDFARTDMAGDGTVNSKSLSDKIFQITNPAPWNKFYKREFIENNGLRFEECAKVNDAYFVYISLALADKIVVIPDELIYYRKKLDERIKDSKLRKQDYFIQPFLNIKNELILRNIFGRLKISFYNMFLAQCFSYLDQIAEDGAFKYLYESLKERVFNDPEIKRLCEDDKITKFLSRKYWFVINHDSEDYGINGQGYEFHEDGMYPFPKNKIKENSRIVIYGAGRVGHAYYNQAATLGAFKEILWVDRNPHKEQGIDVLSPREVDYSGVDNVVVAVENKDVADSIKKYLISEIAVDPGIIIWDV